jgi:hypothetical protein
MIFQQVIDLHRFNKMGMTIDREKVNQGSTVAGISP